MDDIACVVDAGAFLGEGPLWDWRADVLWWLDIKSRLIHRHDPVTGRNDRFPAPQDPGCLAVRERGGLVISLATGFHFFTPESGRFEPIVDPEAELPENRFNDGKPDRQGRFWAGTMHEPQTRPSAALYRLDPDRGCHRVVEGICVSNGLAWSPDSRTMYFADSMANRVWAWDFDPASGNVANRRVFIDTEPTGGVPDGATVDAEGCYWLTVPATSKIIRYDPEGRPMRTVMMPTDLPTCVMFGGADLDTLYVTTATLGRSAEKLAGQRSPGGLFAFQPGVKGLPEAHFRG
jgi:sugar lactone lactonase YvrE